jgi:hypothetical protein
MKDDRIVFIDLLRLFHLNKIIFNEVCNFLGLFIDSNDDEALIEATSMTLEADIIMWNGHYAIRDKWKAVYIFDVKELLSSTEEMKFSELIKNAPDNPLRFDQHRVEINPFVELQDKF